MKRFLLSTAGFTTCFLFLLAGCSKYEPPVSSLRRSVEIAEEGQTSASPASGGETGQAVHATEVPFPAGKISVKIMPPSPSRVSPPKLFVEGAPFEKDLAFRKVQWRLNGGTFDGGETLSPAAFKKGDQIQASGILIAGGREIGFETPEVVAGNSPPEIGEVRLEPKAPATGEKVKAVATGSDPDGDPVKMTHQWFIDDQPVAGEGNERSLAGVKRGSRVHVKVATSDGASEGSWKYSLKHEVVNALPVVISRIPAEVPPDRKFSYRIEAVDPDGDPLTYTLTKAPPGMVLSGSTLGWEIPPGMLGEPVEVVVSISDGNGGLTICTLSMTVREPGNTDSRSADRRQGGRAACCPH